MMRLWIVFAGMLILSLVGCTTGAISGTYVCDKDPSMRITFSDSDTAVLHVPEEVGQVERADTFGRYIVDGDTVKVSVGAAILTFERVDGGLMENDAVLQNCLWRKGVK